MGSNPPLSVPYYCCTKDCGGFAKLHYTSHYTCEDANKRLGEAVGVVEVDLRRGFFAGVGIYLISQVALWLTIQAGRPPTVS